MGMLLPYRALDISDVPVAIRWPYFTAFGMRAARGRGWAAFDASRHPTILAWVLLLKCENSPEDASWQWRYAVCGTGCITLFGFSYQGKLFGEDLPPAAAAQRRAEFERAGLRRGTAVFPHGAADPG